MYWTSGLSDNGLMDYQANGWRDSLVVSMLD